MNFKAFSMASILLSVALTSVNVMAADKFDVSKLPTDQQAKYKDLTPAQQSQLADAWNQQQAAIADQQSKRQAQGAQIDAIDNDIKAAAASVSQAQKNLDAAKKQADIDNANGLGASVFGIHFTNEKDKAAIKAAQKVVDDAQDKQDQLQAKLFAEQEKAAQLNAQATKTQSQYSGKLGEIVRTSDLKNQATDNYLDSLSLSEKFNRSRISNDRLKTSLAKMSATLDQEKVGAYMKEKMLKLLQSPAMCKAVNAAKNGKCEDNKNNGIGRGDIDPLFTGGFTAKEVDGTTTKAAGKQ